MSTNSSQNLTERLEEIARQIVEAAELEDEIKQERAKLRDEFIALTREYKNHMLPVKTIEVPDSFFETTSMSYQEFVNSRFPGWDVTHVETDPARYTTIFVLRLKPDCLAKSIDLGDVRVSKEIIEYAPEVDWGSLERERPDLFYRLASPIMTYKVREDELERLIQEEPHELATLQRHMKVREPAKRVIARKKNG